MSRMDKYENDILEIKKSRTERNEDLYKDIYMNTTIVSLDEVLTDNFTDDIDEPELLIEEENSTSIPVMEERNYDVNVYLEKAKEKRLQENIKKINEDNVDYEKIKIQNDEISRLIKEIETKEKEQDLFKDLLPDNDNTIETTGMIDTRLNTIIEENDNVDIIEDTDDFSDVNNKDNKVIIKKHKVKKLPFIVFVSSLLLLIIVIILLILK